MSKNEEINTLLHKCKEYEILLRENLNKNFFKPNSDLNLTNERGFRLNNDE